MKWFRLYTEWADDPKIQSMSETSQRRHIMLLCVTCDGSLNKLSDDEIACKLRIPLNDLQKTKEEFIKKGFIDEKWNMLNWSKRQYQGDFSAERTRKWREKKVAVTSPSHYRHCDKIVTPPDTDTDTDTDKINIKIKFDRFWDEYPRKVGKGNAEKTFLKLKPDDILFVKIIDALQWQKKIWDDPKYIPHPATWLNGKRWEDERITPKPTVYRNPEDQSQYLEGTENVRSS